MPEPWSGDKFCHAGGEPIPARHGGGRRVSRGNPRRGRMVPGAGTGHSHGHHQCRHRGGGGGCSSIDCAGLGLRELAMDFLPHRCSRAAVDRLVEIGLFPTGRTPQAQRNRARKNTTGRAILRFRDKNTVASFAPNPRGVGTRHRQVPQRCGLVFLPFLAAEVPL